MSRSDIVAARRAAGLHVVTFNVWVGQPIEKLEENLERLAEVLGKPHVIILQEAWRWRRGTIKGYQAVRPTQNRYDQDKNIVILVRNDGKIKHAKSRRVPGAGWYWNGNDKPARVLLRVDVQFRELGKQVWTVIGGHRIPMGPDQSIPKNRESWAKEHKFIVNWVRAIHKRRPRRIIILGMDWNTRLLTDPMHPASLSSLIDDLPNPTAWGMEGIDGFVGVNCDFDHVFELDSKFGSDGHQPVSANATRTLKEAAHE
jgi:hypothetical protein